MRACVTVLVAGFLCAVGCGEVGGWNPGEDTGPIPLTDTHGGADIPAGIDAPAGTDIKPGQDNGNGTDSGSIIPIQSKLYRSGTRIKAKVTRTQDGAQSFLTWYDTELDMDCWFLKSIVDGKYRCLPTLPQALYYSDPACTKMLAYASDCYENRWVYRCTEYQGCQNHTCTYHQRGSQFQGPLYYSLNSDGECNEYEMSESPTMAYYHVGTEIPASTFQEASVEIMEP